MTFSDFVCLFGFRICSMIMKFTSFLF